MPFYPAYKVDGSGRITSPPAIITADNDQEATAAARQLVDGYDVELWDGARFVEKLTRE